MALAYLHDGNRMQASAEALKLYAAVSCAARKFEGQMS